MQNTLEKYALQFLAQVLEEVAMAKIDLKSWEIDHLCYRASSPENYHQLKKEMNKLGDLLIESEVNGRDIATYKLHKPIEFQNYIIDLIELPAPKEGAQTPEGFEHIEVVIDESFQTVIDSYPQLQFGTKGLTKGLNPELDLKLGETRIKFHHMSLENVIHTEKHLSTMQFLEQTFLLQEFSAFSPCLSGTIPLNIDTSESDLDILFCANNLDTFTEEIRAKFSNFTDYQESRQKSQDLESRNFNFRYNELPVELFVQTKESYKQRSHQHFLIEGRLLKILGSGFRKEIINLKTTGLKTELAFGKVLNLQEPYESLVELNKLYDKELKEKFTLR
jgi:predicted metalloenzyme YecM